MPQTQHYYDILGVSRDATPQQIKRAYLRLVRRYHPDVNPDASASERFLEIQEAYQTLSDPQKRAAYDRTLPPEPLQIHFSSSRGSILNAGEPQMVYALLTVAPPPEAVKASQRPPLNVCLVLDRSTSMQGARLQAVKNAALMLIDELQPNDIFSIVTFNDRAEVVVPATRGQSKAFLKQRLQTLSAAGGTEIYQGLQAAYQQVGRFYSPEAINHIILITDGHTYGDEEKCYHLAEQARQRGVVINGLGIGHKWNDAFLDKLAATTGGSANMVRTARDITAFLETHFRGMNTRYAEQVLLDFQLGAGVELRYAFRLAPDAAPLSLDTPMALGHVPREGDLQVVMELLVRPDQTKAEHITVLEGTLSARLPGQHPPLWQRAVQFSLPLQTEADLAAPPPDLVRAMGQLTLYRLQEKAREDVESGQIDKATRRLEMLASHLLAAGNPDLARTVQQEAAHLQTSHTLSEAGQKAIKFGTRSLILPGEKRT